jgi:tRNA dimethylallyltransferase
VKGAQEVLPPIEGAFFLTGPTAGGKTTVGVRLAKLINAEVISLDSMAVYRMMDIGTQRNPRLRKGKGFRTI